MPDTGWDFELFLSGLDDEETVEQLRDVAAAIYAGLDQARSELEMPWQMVSHKRMVMLSQRLAVETVDWTKYDGLLVGTWMAATSRTQIIDEQQEERGA